MGNRWSLFSRIFLKWFFGSIPLTAFLKTFLEVTHITKNSSLMYCWLPQWASPDVISLPAPPSVLQDSCRMGTHDSFPRFAADLPSMVPVKLLIPLVSREDHFSGIDNYYMIAHIHYNIIQVKELHAKKKKKILAYLQDGKWALSFLVVTGRASRPASQQLAPVHL